MRRNVVQKFMRSFVAMGCQVVPQTTYMSKIGISVVRFLDILIVCR